MAELFDSITYEIDFNAGSWTDVSSEVRNNPQPRIRRGNTSNGPQDRVARIGTIFFALKNINSKYSPGHASAQSGFGVGNKVRVSFTFEGETYVKIQGKIPKGGIRPLPGSLGKRYTEIDAHDWMKQVTQHELRLMTLALDQRSDQAIVLVDANLQVSPINTDYRTGSANFPRVFHTTKDRTPAVAEIKHFVDSELAYYYVTGDRTDGETVVMEGRFTRSTSVDTDTLPISISESGKRLLEDGTFKLDEDGSFRILNETEDAVFSNNMADMEVGIGVHLANLIKSESNPVEIDAAATTVLFSLNEVIELKAGETLSGYRGAYIDPSGSGRRVSGTEIVDPPDSGTDFVANAQADGGGANKTAQLTVVASIGTEAIEYELTNSDTASIFITTLQARGKGMYEYQKFESIREDLASQAIHGVISLSVKFKYEPDVTITQSYGDIVLSETTSDDVVVKSILFHANHDSKTMYGFLVLEPGSRLSLVEDHTGVSQDFFVQGYEATIINKNMVDFTIFPRAADLQTFWVLGTSKLGEDTGLGIG